MSAKVGSHIPATSSSVLGARALWQEAGALSSASLSIVWSRGGRPDGYGAWGGQRRSLVLRTLLKSSQLRSTSPKVGQVAVGFGRNGADTVHPSKSTEFRPLVAKIGATSTELGQFGPGSAKFALSSTVCCPTSTNRPNIALARPNSSRRRPRIVGNRTELARIRPKFTRVHPNLVRTRPYRAYSCRKRPARNRTNFDQSWPELGRMRAKTARNRPKLPRRLTTLGHLLKRFWPNVCHLDGALVGRCGVYAQVGGAQP